MARFFVNRPIVAIVISIVTVLLGLVAMSGLPIAQYPEIVPPMVQITTTFVGASATDVEASVATPLEQQINGVENMLYMKSTNANDGTLTLRVSFEVGSNLDMDNVLTQNRVSEATPQLPQAVRNVLPDLIGNTLEVVKLTSIASVVALPELLFQARQAQSITFNATPILVAAVAYFVLLWPFVRLLSRLENRQLAGRR